MKIAVLGSGSHALQVVEYLENIGAFVKWYAIDSEHEKAINKKVIRVHKRFLAGGEKKGLSRLCDLFRVVFEQNPSAEISQQMQGDNVEIFEKLTPLEMDYLKSRFESFEDFDLVLNFPNKNQFYQYAGPGGVAAIGELQADGIDYSHGEWVFTDNEKEIAIVGEESNNSQNLSYLSQWLIEGAGARRVFYITDETNPLEHEKYKESLRSLELYESKRADEFLEKLYKWQKLEDYEKAKIARPQDPIPLLVFFSGHNITAISKLSDQSRLYLTCEIPEWRQAQKGVDNARQTLKTIAVDKLIVANGYYYHNELFHKMQGTIKDSSQIKYDHYEAGLLELDLDGFGGFKDKTEKEIIRELEQIINHYFMESK